MYSRLGLATGSHKAHLFERFFETLRHLKAVLEQTFHICFVVAIKGIAGVIVKGALNGVRVLVITIAKALIWSSRRRLGNG